MTPTPRTNRNCQHCGAPFTALANIARLERELEEAKATHALEQRLTKAMAEEALHVLESRRLLEELTAHKAAVEKVRVALERAQTAIGAPGPASTAWNVTVTIRNALTTLNELKEAKP